MSDEKWKDLKKYACGNHYKLEANIKKGSCSTIRVNFAYLAFSDDEETLITVDSKGNVYYIELGYETPSYRKLGSIGFCTFIAFNPVNKNELLAGLNSSDVKVLRLDSLRNFCLLVGHTIPPTYVSFYKHYCLTSSSKEAIIWDLRCYCKIHQLRLNTERMCLKKASFSSQGLIAVLYPNDVIQAWTFQHFGNDFKVNTKKFGFRNVKDFVFTKDGRAMIIAGVQNKILVFNTHDWNLLKSLDFKELPGAKQLAIVPQPLDGGANKFVAILSSDCNLKFLDLMSSNFMKNCCGIMHRIKRVAVSNSGKFAAHVDQEGILVLTNLERIVNVKRKEIVKAKEPSKLRAHHTTDHLQCIKESVKEELKLERLLPILKEFGEYPEKHRMLVWATVLQLPANRQAYVSLGNQVSENVRVDLLKDYPLSDKSKASLLSITLEKLLQWCPFLANSTILPGLVFPFTVVFQKDPVLAFEAILSILMNYCQKWFEYHPLPPLNILAIIENIFLETDPTLLHIFCERKITSTDYAWPLLRTTLSEVLSADEWLILWDHLLSYCKPSLLLMCTLAYSICARETIISSLKSPEEFERFYSTQGHVRVKDLLRVAHRLEQQISDKVHPCRYLRNKMYILPSEGPYPQFLQDEYPRIVLSVDNMEYLQRLEEEEQSLEESRIQAMRLAEEKRLRTEAKKFVEQIHRSRLKEVEKCLEKQVRDHQYHLDTSRQNIQRGMKRNKHSGPQYFETDNRNCGSDIDIREADNQEKCERLRHQVQRLESEVYNLLGSLQSNTSKRNVYNKQLGNRLNRNI